MIAAAASVLLLVGTLALFTRSRGGAPKQARPEATIAKDEPLLATQPGNETSAAPISQGVTVSTARPTAGISASPAAAKKIPPVTTPPSAGPKPPADPSPNADVRSAEVKDAMGLQLLEQGKFIEAISSFTEVIALNPRLPEAYMHRCQAYQQVKMRDRAIEDCDRAIELKPAYPEAYLWRGRANFPSRPDRAIDDCTEAIRLNPEFRDAYIERGIYYANSPRKRPELAIQDFTQAIRVRPTDFNAYYLRGQKFTEQKDYDSAIRDYSESIRLRPWGTTYILRGDAYRVQAQYQRAVQDYSEAIRLWTNPYPSYAYAGRAAAKDSLGDKAGAAADRQRAEELKSALAAAQPSTVPAPAVGSSPTADARAAEVKHAQGLQLEHQRNLSEAISAFTEAIRLKPDFAEAYYHRCSCYGMLNIPAMSARAVEDCTKAIEIQRDLEGAYEYRGLLYLGQRNYDRAIEDSSEAIRLQPNDASAYHVRAGAYAGQNRPDLAIRDYTVSLRIRPSWNSYYYRAEQYVRQKQADLAIQDCAEAIRLYPDYGLSYKVRGDAYQLKHEYDRAIQDYNEAIRLAPKYGSAYTARGAAKELLGDKTGAAADRQRAQELR
jgi:tetratricopeptide (TPR) repeat protein